MAVVAAMLARAGRVSRRLMAGLACGVVAACGIDSYFIYMPQPLSAAADARARRAGAQALAFGIEAGVTLHGWLANAGGAERRPLVIYYGGNADEVSWMLDEAARLPGSALLLVNYRGYGRSTGTPREDRLFADALAVFDQMVARADIDAERVVVWGRSLGTGVAVHVASERKVAGVVLVSPYDSMTALAERHMPLLRGLLTQPFDSLGRASRVNAPLLALAAARDTLIPPVHSERLVAAWRGPKSLELLSEGDHNSLSSYPAHWQVITRFVGSVTEVSR